jgi:hypothetical protein
MAGLFYLDCWISKPNLAKSAGVCYLDNCVSKPNLIRKRAGLFYLDGWISKPSLIKMGWPLLHRLLDFPTNLI